METPTWNEHYEQYANAMARKAKRKYPFAELDTLAAEIRLAFFEAANTFDASKASFSTHWNWWVKKKLLYYFRQFRGEIVGAARMGTSLNTEWGYFGKQTSETNTDLLDFGEQLEKEIGTPCKPLRKKYVDTLLTEILKPNSTHISDTNAYEQRKSIKKKLIQQGIPEKWVKRAFRVGKDILAAM